MSNWVPNPIPGRRLRTFEVVIQRIHQAIADGELRPGDRLPSERDLSSALGVSRTSVREAIRVLEALGIVKVRVGSGPDHGVSIREQPGNELIDLFGMWVALQHIDIEDLVGFRAAVEGWACSVEPLESAASDALRNLSSITSAMTETTSKEKYLELDTEFHQELVRFSGNRLAAIVNAAVRGSIRSHMEAAFERLEDWSTERNQLTREHQAIYDHLEAGRQERAREAVIAHVRRFYSSYVSEIEK